VQGVGATAGLFAAPAILGGLRADAAAFNDPLFALGVASGDPGAHSVVLWTRLAPDPLNGGGMAETPVLVRWQVASDPGMANVLRSGAAIALPRNGHAVHVVARGLPSDSWFYYRFEALGEFSRVGRTRTFPGRRDVVAQMRFATASCQDFRDGFYPAYRDMAEQELDFVVHLGDYIYENGPRGNPIAEGRNHVSEEVFTVEQYRDRYALYRLDLNLQEAHARFPFIVTWDDHEVDNNYAGRIAEEDAPAQGEAFLERRHNAYQVYSETMPLRPANRKHGPHMRLFRKLRFGDLADIHVLDTRQFRTDQPAEDGFGSTDDPVNREAELLLGETLFDATGILDPNATMLGEQQERWLTGNLARSRATWNILAQQVMLGQWNLSEAARLGTLAQLPPGTPPEQQEAIDNILKQIDDIFNVDTWDGYQAARRRLLDVLAQVRPNNPVVLSGDIHSAWGINLLDDFGDPNSDILAAEFVCTAISATFDALDPRPADALTRASVLADNPQVEFFNGLFRGYCICDVDRARWRTTYRAAGTLADVLNPDPFSLVPFEDTPVETDAVLEIEAGFNAPGSGARIEAAFARIPLGA
jgi:alkaline phosphatase D